MDSPIFSEAPAIGGLDNRLIAAMRLVLSSSVLFIIAQSDLDELGAFQTLSALYSAYSAFLYLLAVRQVDGWYLGAAWIFFAFRVLHSVVHCTFNFVPLRFWLYAISAVALWFMVVRTAWHIFF